MTTAELLQALVDDLNDHVFSRAFTAQRAYLPLVELGELDTLHVTIVPAGRTQVLASRHSVQLDHRIDVIVQQRLDNDVPAAVDPLLALVEELATHLAAHRLSAAPSVEWVQTEHSPLLAQDHLHELRQFTSVLALTYRSWESA